MGNGCSPGCRFDDVFGGVLFCAVLFFLRDVLDEICDWIEPAPEDFSYLLSRSEDIKYTMNTEQEV